MRMTLKTHSKTIEQAQPKNYLKQIKVENKNQLFKATPYFSLCIRRYCIKN